MSRTGWSSSNFLRYAGLPGGISGPPFTMAGWVNLATTAGSQNLFGFFGASGRKLWSRSSGGVFTFDGENGGSTASADTSVVSSVGVWNHVFAVAASTTSRSIIANGNIADKATNTTSLSPTLTRFSVGRDDDGSAGAANAGTLIAEVGLWNIALSDADAVALAAGAPPFLVHPEALVGYWPLLGANSPENNLLSNTSKLSIQGSMSAGVHPRIFMPN